MDIFKTRVIRYHVRNSAIPSVRERSTCEPHFSWRKAETSLDQECRFPRASKQETHATSYLSPLIEVEGLRDCVNLVRDTWSKARRNTPGMFVGTEGPPDPRDEPFEACNVTAQSAPYRQLGRYFYCSEVVVASCRAFAQSDVYKVSVTS